MVDGRKYLCACVCVFLSNLFIMRADKPSDRLADGLRVELLFLFRFPITSYNIFHFLLLSPSTLAHTAFIYPHTRACTHTHSITLSPRRAVPHSLSPFMFDQSPSRLSPLAANGGADGVKAIFCKSERCVCLPH